MDYADLLALTDSLAGQLRDRQPTLARFDDYYSGRHPLAFASQKFRQAFGTLFSAFADNWCDLVVDATEERLNVEGFRLGQDGTNTGDKDAWRIWQSNNLDAESQVAHTEALISGEAAVLVSPNPADDRTPLITVESPQQMIVATSPSDRRKRTAALKVWEDGSGYVLATLYLPDGIYKWQSKTRAVAGMVPTWMPREVPGETWPVPNPIGVVPVVPLVNRPRLLLAGDSELRRVMPLQDAANKFLADMIIASEYAAFRQRWVTGMEIPVDPVSNQPIEPFKAAVDRLWINENPDAKFGEFSEATLTNYVGAIELVVQHIASQTRTPPHYFYLSGQFPSGESIKSAETGLVAKVIRKQRHFGEAWEEVLRLAFSFAGDTGKAAITDGETIWADPESRTEGEHVDAILKKQALGVPQRQLWEDLGYSPQQIERFAAMKAEEAAQVATVGLAGALMRQGAPPPGIAPANGAPVGVEPA